MFDLIPDGVFLIGPGRHDRVLRTRTRARTRARTHARTQHTHTQHTHAHATHTHTIHTRTQHKATRTQDPRQHTTHTICSRVRPMHYRRSRVNVYYTPSHIYYTPTHIFCTRCIACLKLYDSFHKRDAKNNMPYLRIFAEKDLERLGKLCILGTLYHEERWGAGVETHFQEI